MFVSLWIIIWCSFLFFLFFSFLCASCWKWFLSFYSSLSNTALLFFSPFLIYSTIALTLLVAWQAHLCMLLLIGLVFIVQIPLTLLLLQGRFPLSHLHRTFTTLLLLLYHVPHFLTYHRSINIHKQVSTIDSHQKYSI